MRPSAVSRSISLRTVIRATPKRTASSRSEGSSLPGGRLASRPSRIARTCAPFGRLPASRRGSRAAPALAGLPRRAIEPRVGRAEWRRRSARSAPPGRRSRCRRRRRMRRHRTRPAPPRGRRSVPRRVRGNRARPTSSETRSRSGSAGVLQRCSRRASSRRRRRLHRARRFPPRASRRRRGAAVPASRADRVRRPAPDPPGRDGGSRRARARPLPRPPPPGRRRESV